MPAPNPKIDVHGQAASAIPTPLFQVPAFPRVHTPEKKTPGPRTSLRGLQIQGTGLYVPDNLVTNDQLAKHGYDANWIIKRTGIQSRYIAGPETSTSDMATLAAQECLQKAGCSPDEVDLIIIATVSPDHRTPSTAAIVQGRLGCHCPAFDLNAACSGFVYSMVMAGQFLKTGASQKVLVIGAEKMSLMCDPLDKKTFPIFGDGAGAVLLGINDEYVPGDYQEEQEQGPANLSPGILAYQIQSLGELGSSLVIPGGGSREPFSQDCLDNRRQFVKMDGRSVFKWAVRVVPEIVSGLLEKAKLTADQVDMLVLHQANRRIIDAAVESTDIPAAKAFVNVDRYGNTSAASIPIALHEASLQGEISPGDVVMMIGFGAGLTWGGCVLRW